MSLKCYFHTKHKLSTKQYQDMIKNQEQRRGQKLTRSFFRGVKQLDLPLNIHVGAPTKN